MGAWGYGNFDNDEAADWVWELEDAGSLEPVISALETIENSRSEPEAFESSVALAAAEVVAAIFGRPSADFPESLVEIAQSLSASAPENLRARARAVALRIKAESELRDLWVEPGGLAAWEQVLDDLLNRLA